MVLVKYPEMFEIAIKNLMSNLIALLHLRKYTMVRFQCVFLNKKATFSRAMTPRTLFLTWSTLSN